MMMPMVMAALCSCSKGDSDAADRLMVMVGESLDGVFPLGLTIDLFRDENMWRR